MTKKLRSAVLATSLALIGAVGLAVAPASQAAPAVGQFSVPTLPGLPKSTSIPKSGDKYIDVKVTFSGTAADSGTTGDSNGDGANVYYRTYHGSTYASPSIDIVKTNIKSYVSKPSINASDYSSTIAPGTSNLWRIRITQYTSPGVYRVTFPVTQFHTVNYNTVKTTKTATATFTVKLNKKAAKSNFSVGSFSYRVGRTATIYTYAHETYRGKKVTLQYKPKGAKKWRNVGKAKKFKLSSSRSRAIFKTNALRKVGKIRFKVKKSKYGAKFTSKAVTIKRR